MNTTIGGMLQELAEIFGYNLKPKNPNAWSDIFWYVFPRIQNLAAGATSAPQALIIQKDSDFEWTHSVYFYDLAQAAFVYNTRPIPNMSVILQETGSGKQLMSGAVPVTSIFGRPEEPYCLPQPKILVELSTITATVTNFDAASATGDLWLVLGGRKLINQK